jgi:hypothetical protein
MAGNYDPATKSYTYVGNTVCPATGAMLKSKTINRVIDEKNHVMESYSILPNGQELKTMEVVYKRK